MESLHEPSLSFLEVAVNRASSFNFIFTGLILLLVLVSVIIPKLFSFFIHKSGCIQNDEGVDSRKECNETSKNNHGLCRDPFVRNIFSGSHLS